MGVFFYNIILGIYNALLLVFSLFNEKAGKIISGRRATFSRIRELRKSEKNLIWVHCASLGEFEQARPVLDKIEQTMEGYQVYISFFSSSGYEVRRNYGLADCVFYLPADSASNARRVVEILKPVLVIFVKYEFWYHYLKVCSDHRIPVVSIATILRPNHFIFSFWGGFYRRMLYFFEMFFAQDEQTKKLLQGIGITNIMVAGDTRFDRVEEIYRQPQELPLIKNFGKEKKLIILGSTWKSDIDLWMDYINSNSNSLKFIIAPHHINDIELRNIEKKIRKKTTRYSMYRYDSDRDSDVLIIDNIGILSSIYNYGYITYVGGSFSEGLHNILEPATFGKPVLIGKNKSNAKFREAVGLTEKGGAFEVGNPGELGLIVNKLLQDQIFYQDTCRISRRYVENNLGATQRIMESLVNLLAKA